MPTILSLCQSARGAPADDDALRECVLAAALQFVAAYGPYVTLGEAEHPRGGGEWTRAVREILFAQLDRPALSLPSVARILAVSARTLQRRLADEGTSWRAEIDAARRERTRQLLQQGTTSDVTAVRVGYSGSRALRRALRRWRPDQADA